MTPREKLFDYCLTKDAMLQWHYLKNKSMDNLWPYNNKLTRAVINGMLNWPLTNDTKLCPWCILQMVVRHKLNWNGEESCNGCIYGEVFGKCNAATSRYQLMLRKLGADTIVDILREINIKILLRRLK